MNRSVLRCRQMQTHQRAQPPPASRVSERAGTRLLRLTSAFGLERAPVSVLLPDPVTVTVTLGHGSLTGRAAPGTCTPLFGEAVRLRPREVVPVLIVIKLMSVKLAGKLPHFRRRL